MKEQIQIDHPDYYQGKIEVIDFIEAFDFNFNLGNVVKYISRAGHKPDSDYLTDLSKAEWYLHREIIRVMKKEEQNSSNNKQ